MEADPHAIEATTRLEKFPLAEDPNEVGNQDFCNHQGNLHGEMMIGSTPDEVSPAS